MRGKTVVITGGTSGIGEIVAEKLAKRGARIILVARDKTRGDAILVRLRNCALASPPPYILPGRRFDSEDQGSHRIRIFSRTPISPVSSSMK